MAVRPGTITVSRTDPRDIGYREVFVSLDGQSIGILRHGGTITSDAEPGHHRIRAHNTLIWKTIDFDLQPGEHARFTAINKAGWGTYSVLAWIGAGPIYLTFEKSDPLQKTVLQAGTPFIGGDGSSSPASG